MKIVQINATCGSGSTGKICVAISELLTKHKIENYILYCYGESSYPLGIKCSENKYIKIQALKARLWGNWGFQSKAATIKILTELDRIQPDIVHLHNIHGHDCNLEMLFRYFKEKKTKLFWTFHDCWAFTGYCMYFILAGCDKWKRECACCPQRKNYSYLFDRSRGIFEKKKKLFSNLDLTIIVPSLWLANLVRESFLQKYPIKVIHNGINLNIFNPRESVFREEYGLQDKHIVLGVAFDWGVRKGLDAFLNLAERLDERYQIVLVGTNGKVDKQLPGNIISIHRTQDQRELAEIYSASDVFVNPTREEVLGLVNIESIACGTPVITFRTGGSPECIDNTCGSVVDVDDIDSLQAEIQRICTQKPYSKEACLQRAAAFDMNDRFQEYIDLYKEIYDRTATM